MILPCDDVTLSLREKNLVDELLYHDSMSGSGVCTSSYGSALYMFMFCPKIQACACCSVVELQEYDESGFLFCCFVCV